MAAQKTSTSKTKKTTDPEVPGITIEIDKPTQVPISLGDEVYLGFAPKTGSALVSIKKIQQQSDDPEAMFQAVQDWLNEVFEPKDAKRIVERLYDPSDGLDLPHIVELIRQLVTTAVNPIT